MDLGQVAAFYAPFVGLLGVVFWLGVLSQRVKQLESTVSDLREADETGNKGDRLTRLEVKMEHANDKLDSLERGMQGVQRQLGNLMTGQAFKPALTDRD